MRRFLWLSVLATALAARPASGQVPGAFPLEQGTVWSYRNDLDEPMLAVISGSAMVLGRPCVRRVVSCLYPVPQTIENYWTADALGNVYLHGFWNLDTGTQRAYRPPLLWLPAGLAAGQQWSTACDVFHRLDGSSLGWSQTFMYRCTATMDVVTPLGTFSSHGVGQTLGDWDAAGELKAGYHDVIWWYHVGLGLVRQETGGIHPYLLVEHSGPLASVPSAPGREPRTWSAVKTLFD